MARDSDFRLYELLKNDSRLLESLAQTAVGWKPVQTFAATIDAM
jgi:hypothetical protein